MDFGDAVRALKAGKRVARSGWNGKSMWLALVVPIPSTGEHPPLTYRVFKPMQSWISDQELRPWIGMKTVDGGFVPWLASQTDMLAEDWSEHITWEDMFARAALEIPPGQYAACKLAEDQRDGTDLFVVEHRASTSEPWPASQTMSQLDGLMRVTTARVPTEVRADIARELLAYSRRK